ncbi:MAG: hypothetical protein DI586_00380 [Micavibrio aeruginosavorus]|uniref:Uncharacterized protein n=1 Tax=Micavibrio aeruginosavorus TaxID=349221 RepID=A0A2W5FN42_9BACT|nr:MAG: hypothetical protein DI586_00380 [Micavibrio aeruginosavorus]
MENGFNRSSSYVEWSAIFAGAVLASALSLVMLQFGAVVGVADMNAFTDSVSNIEITPARLIMAALYILIIQVLASMLGGYVAGRMRAPISAATEHEKEVRDGVHGVLVWATATLAVAVSVALMGAFAQIAIDQPAEVNTAQEVLDQQHRTAILLSFAAASTSLVSGVAAWVAGVKGGDHRDLGIDFGRHITFLIRR